MRVFSNVLLMLVMVLTLVCGGCLTFSGGDATSEEKVRLERINGNLPFSVAIDGNEAVVATEFCAEIAEPVRPDSELILGVPNDDVIVISFFPCDEEGVVAPGGKPSLIILRGNSKTSLKATFDGKPLPSGHYLMRVTAGDKTANVLLKIVK
jgi:hypothetical protein